MPGIEPCILVGELRFADASEAMNGDRLSHGNGRPVLEQAMDFLQFLLSASEVSVAGEAQIVHLSLMGTVLPVYGGN